MNLSELTFLWNWDPFNFETGVINVRRLNLHEILVAILGSRNVYFQPPESLAMNYPAIVYDLRDIETRKANNRLYNSKTRYVVTVITKDPDSEIPGKIGELPYASFSRSFTAENLNHYTYFVYY